MASTFLDGEELGRTYGLSPAECHNLLMVARGGFLDIKGSYSISLRECWVGLGYETLDGAKVAVKRHALEYEKEHHEPGFIEVPVPSHYKGDTYVRATKDLRMTIGLFERVALAASTPRGDLMRTGYIKIKNRYFELMEVRDSALIVLMFNAVQFALEASGT